MILFGFGRIKNDDKMIQAEGVESLSEAELRQACRDRRLLGLLSMEEMRQQVSDQSYVSFSSTENYAASGRSLSNNLQGYYKMWLVWISMRSLKQKINNFVMLLSLIVNTNRILYGYIHVCIHTFMYKILVTY